jgi:hypothetical protein
MNPLQISNIVMNVTMISTFIGIFFFTYGKIIEENVVKGQSELVANYLAKDLSTFIDNATAQKLTSQLSPPDMTNADKQVELKNAELQSSAFNILILVAVGGLLFTIILAKYYTLNLQSILKTNFVILLFVGLTEYIFLTYIGQNFISLDPNFVRLKILQALQKKMSEQELTLTPETIKKLLPEQIKELHSSYPTLENNNPNQDVSRILQNIPK